MSGQPIKTHFALLALPRYCTDVNCYSVEAGLQKNWTAAKEYCERLPGGFLAEMKNEEEYQVIGSLFYRVIRRGHDA